MYDGGVCACRSNGTCNSFASRRNNNGSLKKIAPFGEGGNDGPTVNTPITDSGNATTNPASGPANPISNSARRDGIGERILINAPNVPVKNNGGAGMKNGSVALTLTGT